MEISWDLLATLATIIGVIIGVIIAIIQLRLLSRRKKLKCLEGKWFEYHWTNADRADTFKWLQSYLSVKPGLFKSYKLDYENYGVMYYGRARYIDKKDISLNGDILLKVQQKRMSLMSMATVYFRYNVPEISNENQIVGIWLSYNFAKKITSGASILSRKELSDAELDAKFNQYFKIDKASIFVKSTASKRADSFMERILRSVKKA